MNKRMKMLAVAGLLVAGGLLSVPYLSAQPMDSACYGRGHHSGHMMHKPRFDRDGHHRDRGLLREVKRLDLSSEQKEKIGALMQERRQTMDEQRRTRRDNRKALKEAMGAQPYDVERVRRLAETQGATVTRRILSMAETRRQVMALLTPEQRARLDERRSATSRK